jgi:CheY-specific phosphatase CheX
MNQELYQAAALTFEELGFVFPYEADDNDTKSIKDGAKVAVEFTGPFSGRLVLHIENDALSVIASNMMGEEEPLDPALVMDILGELANVICGNALPAIAGKQKIFHLSAPEFEILDSDAGEPSAKAFLNLDEGSADVTLYVN